MINWSRCMSALSLPDIVPLRRVQQLAKFERLTRVSTSAGCLYPRMSATLASLFALAEITDLEASRLTLDAHLGYFG